MELTDIHTVIVLGAGESGTGAAILAKQQGYEVFVSDQSIIKSEYIDLLEQHQITYEQEKHSVAKILNTASVVVKSPGIPYTVDLIQQLIAKNIPVIDEIEWASWFTQAKIIAITGSNGKTTTARLMHHVLETAGWNVGLAGNVGYSFAKQVALASKDAYVLELSSFQLDGIQDFSPAVSILLNITPDHLDRYAYQLDNYIASKFRIIKNKKNTALFIYNEEDENIKKALPQGLENSYAVSMAALDNDNELLNVAHTNFSIAKKDLTLKGRHNWFNSSCAVLAAKKLGLSDKAIAKALTSFENEAHRLESVIAIHGVEYINDSKATNVDAVYYALEAMTKPVVWIVGGVDKGNDYSVLFPLVKEKVRAIICLGRDNAKIKEAFAQVHEIIVETVSVQEALKVSSLYAESGDVVLLSPACASFDLFENYKARGNQFKTLLMQQYEVLTKGVSVQLNLNVQMNPTDQRTDLS